MQPLVEHRIQLARHSVRALELDGSGPGIVLLHGWGQSADIWAPLLDELAVTGRRAIAIDFPAAATLDPGRLVPQLEAVAAELVAGWSGGEQVVVAGTSLGGCLALRLRGWPDLPLAGVVPLAPAGLAPTGWSDVVERDPVVRGLLDIPIPVPTALLGAAPGAATPGPESPGLPGALVDLSEIGCPVLLVWGAHDRLAPPSPARRAFDALPSTRVALLEGAGRRPELEATPRLLELLLPFPGS